MSTQVPKGIVVGNEPRGDGVEARAGRAVDQAHTQRLAWRVRRHLCDLKGLRGGGLQGPVGSHNPAIDVRALLAARARVGEVRLWRASSQ